MARRRQICLCSFVANDTIINDQRNFIVDFNPPSAREFFRFRLHNSHLLTCQNSTSIRKKTFHFDYDTVSIVSLIIKIDFDFDVVVNFVYVVYAILNGLDFEGIH